jgi:hypothetical protein
VVGVGEIGSGEATLQIGCLGHPEDPHGQDEQPEHAELAGCHRQYTSGSTDEIAQPEAPSPPASFRPEGQGRGRNGRPESGGGSGQAREEIPANHLRGEKPDDGDHRDQPGVAHGAGDHEGRDGASLYALTVHCRKLTG